MDKRIEFKEHERSILARPVHPETGTQEATLLYNVNRESENLHTYMDARPVPRLIPTLSIGCCLC